MCCATKPLKMMRLLIISRAIAGRCMVSSIIICDDIPARHILTDLLGEGSDEIDAKVEGFDFFLGDAGRAFFVMDKTVDPDEYYEGFQEVMDTRFTHCSTTMGNG